MTVPDPGASGRASEPPPTRTVNAGRARPTTFSLLARWDRWASSRSRLRYLPPRLARHLTDVGDMLDIGSGNGQIAQRLLQSDPTLSITAVDVMVQPDPCIAVSQYDGIRLPFADNTFDAVILIDVLHHDRQPERLLREALRVARRRVLIKDHYWITRWDRMLLSIADYLGNRAYGIELPYNFLKIEGWLELFDRAGARVARVEKFRYSVLDRVKQIIFVLEPPTSATGATVDRAGRPDASGIATVKTSS